jgi:hypothetical protein
MGTPRVLVGVGWTAEEGCGAFLCRTLGTMRVRTAADADLNQLAKLRREVHELPTKSSNCGKHDGPAARARCSGASQIDR